MSEARSVSFVLCWVGLFFFLFVFVLHGVLYRNRLRVAALMFGFLFALINMLYLHSSFIYYFFSNHPGYLCAHSTTHILPIRSHAIEQAQTVAEICPIEVVNLKELYDDEEKMPKDFLYYDKAFKISLLPSEKADSLMYSYVRLVLFNMGLMTFANLLLTFITIHYGSPKRSSNILKIAEKPPDSPSGRKKTQRHPRSRIPTKLVWIVLATITLCALYLSLILAHPSGATSMLVAFLQGNPAGAVKPPLYPVPP